MKKYSKRKGKILRERIKREGLGSCVDKKKGWSRENWVEHVQAKVLSGYVPEPALPCLVLRIGIGCCLRSPCEHQKPSWPQSWAANHQVFMLRTFLQLPIGLRTIDCLLCTSAYLCQCSSNLPLREMSHPPASSSSVLNLLNAVDSSLKCPRTTINPKTVSKSNNSQHLHVCPRGAEASKFKT